MAYDHLPFTTAKNLGKHSEGVPQTPVSQIYTGMSMEVSNDRFVSWVSYFTYLGDF